MGLFVTPLAYWPGRPHVEILQDAWLALAATAAAFAVAGSGFRTLGRGPHLLLAGWATLALAGLVAWPRSTDTFELRRALIHLSALAAATYAFAGAAEHSRGARFLRHGAAATGAVVAALAVLAGLGGFAHNQRWLGTLGNPNWAGAYAALHAPLLLALWHERPGLLAGAGGFACAALIAGSGSRGAWLATCCAAAVFAVLVGRAAGPRRAARALGPAALALAAGFLLAIATRAAAPAPKPGLTDPAVTHSLDVRARIWLASARMVLDHPLAGVGLGQFPAAFPPYRDPDEHRSSGARTRVDDAHNTYLGRIAEGGLLGAAGLGVLLAGLVASLRPLPRDPEPPWARAGAVAAVAAAAGAAFFTDILPHPALLAAVAMLGPLALAAGPPKESGPDRRSLLVPVAVLTAGVLAALFAIPHAQAAMAHRWGACLNTSRLAGLHESLTHADDWFVTLSSLAWETSGGPNPAEGPEGWFAAALALRPSDPALLNDRGVLRARSGRLAEAEADLTAAIAIAPAFSDAWFNLGNVLAQAGRDAEARRAFARAAEATNGYPEACRNAAILATKAGDASEALAWLRRLNELDRERLRETCSDSAFASLAGNPEFEALRKK